LVKNYKAILITLMILLPLNNLFADEKESYEEIITLEKNNDRTAINAANAFIKKFPKSKYIPNVKILRADNEKNIDKAVLYYYDIVNNYKYFSECDYCQYRICQIYYMTSRWKDLSYESEKGLMLFGKNNRYHDDFKFFLAKSYYHLQNSDEAISIMNDIKTNSKKYYFYPETEVFGAFLFQNIKGNSNKYKSDLKNVYYTFEGTGADVSALYLFARHCEMRKEYTPAYSAYTDLINKFPRSPEANLAKIRLSEISKYKPQYITNYFDKIKNSDNLFLQHETVVDDEEKNSFYSVEIGPIYNLAKAERIKKELSPEFKPVIIVKKKKEFSVYIGRINTTEDALSVRIRLAEEYGLNGNIIYIRSEDGQNYIYGE